MKWQLFSSLGFVCLFSFEVLVFKHIYIIIYMPTKTLLFLTSIPNSNMYASVKSNFSKNAIQVFKTCFFKGVTCGTLENVTQLTFKGQKK